MVTSVQTGSVVRETLWGKVSPFSVAAVTRESLWGTPAPLAIAAVTRETLWGRVSPLTVASVVRESLWGKPGPFRTSSVTRETLLSDTAIVSVRLAAVAREILRSLSGGPNPPSFDQGTPWPPTGPVSVVNTIPSYLYVQYRNDDNLQSFVFVYNAFAQAYLDYINGLNLPVYTNGNIAGPLLDWVGTNLYGIVRPALPKRGSAGLGPYNTWRLNSVPFNFNRAGTPDSFNVANDDYYKRVLTWFFYKGDGKVFTPHWLKRRVNRFLNGPFGTDVSNDQTYGVSVAPTGFKAWTITVITSPAAVIFSEAVAAGLLELPVQTTWRVSLI